MEKDNWEKGDIAICVKVGALNSGDYKYPPLKLYGEYVVNDIHRCSCGCLALDVGLIADMWTQCDCLARYPGDNTHWCDSVRFVKKQTKEMVQMELNAAVEAENYELAQILKERLEAV